MEGPPQSPSGVLLELSQMLSDKAKDIKRMAEAHTAGDEEGRSSSQRGN